MGERRHPWPWKVGNRTQVQPPYRAIDRIRYNAHNSSPNVLHFGVELDRNGFHNFAIEQVRREDGYF